MRLSQRFFLILLPVCLSGCGQKEPDLPSEIEALRARPPMTAHHGPGFDLDLPDGWTMDVSGSTVFLNAVSGEERIKVEIRITPYEANETPDSVVDDAELEARRKKAFHAIMNQRIGGFPGLLQMTNQAGEMKLPSDQIRYLLGTPAGKISVVGNCSSGRGLPEWHRLLSFIVDSIRMP